MTATIAVIILLEVGYREIQIITTIIATFILALTVIYFLAVSIGPYVSRRLSDIFPESSYTLSQEEDETE